MKLTFVAVIFSFLFSPLSAMALLPDGATCKAYADCESKFCYYTSKGNQPRKGTCTAVTYQQMGTECKTNNDCRTTLCQSGKCVCKTSMMPCGNSNQCCAGKNGVYGSCIQLKDDGFQCQIPH